MKKDAETHADEDKKKQELIETQNAADQVVYAGEKALREHGDKVGDDIKKNVQEKIDVLKTARAGSDVNKIKTASEELSRAMSAIGEAMSKDPQQQPPQNDQPARPDDSGQSGGQPPPEEKK